MGWFRSRVLYRIGNLFNIHTMKRIRRDNPVLLYTALTTTTVPTLLYLLKKLFT